MKKTTHPGVYSSSKQAAFRHFLETTSVKGVPKVAKSHNKCIQLLWLVASLFGFSVAVYFITGLFVLYFKHTSSLQYSERTVTSEDFPDITLCSLNPFANSPYGSRNIEELFKTIEEVYNPQLREFLQNPNFDAFLYPDFQNLFRPGKLLEFLVSDLPQRGYNETHNLIVQCEWATNLDNNSCTNEAEVHLFTTDFGYCFTFRPPAMAEVVTGFSALLYLDSTSLQTHMPVFPLGLGGIFTGGATIMVHPPGSLPMIGHGVRVETGYHSTLTIHMERHLRLGQPFSNCEHKPDLYTCWKDLEVEGRIPYDRQQCVDFCFQKEVMQKCGCITGSRLSLYAMRENRTFCGLPTAFDAVNVFRNMNNMLRCVESIREPTCPNACSNDQYYILMSRSKWPHPAYVLAFYEGLIKGKPYAGNFAIHDTGVRNSSNTSVYQHILIRDQIRKNFLQVDVVWQRSTMAVYRERASLEVESLIGNMGGVLNLWVGITFFTIMEVIEMFISMCIGFKHSNCTKSHQKSLEQNTVER